MNRYENVTEFRRAIEEKLNHSIRPIVWDIIRDTLRGYALHSPYTDGDVDFALPIVKKILNVANENRKGEFCPYQEHPVFCQEGICERCFIYETYVR